MRWKAEEDRTINDMIGELRSDFRASHDSRFMQRLTGVHPQGSGADYHYRYERQFLHMMERSRHYERDNPVIGQGISRLSANVMQDGFTPDPDTGSKELDSIWKDNWAEWSIDADLCHSEGEHTFHDMEELVFRSAIRDGDIFSLPLVNGSLQLVEGHRPRTPRGTRRNVVHGILLDRMKQRQELWLSREEIGLNQTVRRVSDIYPVPYRDDERNRQVFQVYFPKRTSQTRGYPAVAPVSDTAGQADDLFFTTLVKSQMASLVVLLREMNINSPAGTNGEGLGNGQKPGIRPISGVNAGLDVTARPGETIKFASANIPNAEFFTHANLLLTFVAINLDMPVAMLLLDASNTNFSGWRGVMDQARVRFRLFQRQMVSRFHRPVYKWKVRNWLLSNPRAARLAEAEGIRPFRHKWKVPGWPYIEPFKDTQADNLQQEKFLNSPRRIQGARGREWEELAPEIVEDKSLLIELAIQRAEQFATDYPEAGVTWRDILGPGLNSTPAMTAPQPVPVEASS